MQADRFTIKSQEALLAAARIAEARRNPQVTPAHLLAVLLETGVESSASPDGPRRGPRVDRRRRRRRAARAREARDLGSRAARGDEPRAG